MTKQIKSLENVLTKEQTLNYLMTVFRGGLVDNNDKKDRFRKVLLIMLERNFICGYRSEQHEEMVAFNLEYISKGTLYDILARIHSAFFEIALTDYVKMGQKVFVCNDRSYHTIYNNIQNHYHHEVPDFLYNFFAKKPNNFW